MSSSVVFSVNDNSPETLFDTCLNVFVKHFFTIAITFTNRRHTLNDGVILPAEICEAFLEKYQRYTYFNEIVTIMFHREHRQTNLEIIKLKNSDITNESFRVLLEHKPVTLEVNHCDSIDHRSLERINTNSQNLLTLKIINTHITSDETSFRNRGYILCAPKLKNLTVHKEHIAVFSNLFLNPLQTLIYLDLSECDLNENNQEIMTGLPHLQYLILYGVPWALKTIDWIVSMPTIRHLDLSHFIDYCVKFANPNEVLTRLVTSLPNLEHLDISCTNLAGTGAAAVASVDNIDGFGELMVHSCDIPGLVSRVGNPLKFLGLYETQHGACTRRDIPAKNITGDSTKEQILLAAESYIHRPAILTRVFNDIYFLFRYEYDVPLSRTLGIILKAMEEHIVEKHIQISGSAILYYIVKGKEKDNMGIKLKKRIITTLLDGMETHVTDSTMMRNGCLAICQFIVPSDVLFEYTRIVTILLTAITDHSQDGFVQRITIYLLNALACQVDNEQKLFLGNQNAIRIMLGVISDRLDNRICDDVLEVAWSTIWNVTDEMPRNCARFLDDNGMDLFLYCFRSFPDREELLRNMMGLLGNVAEVAVLRPRLMDKLFINVFYDLLNSSSDGIEVSYNAAGVLVHLASDGIQAWTVEEPYREVVLQRVAEAVHRWDLHTERNINYRSFEPILNLLKVFHTPQCQHWAVWALANLTTVYPEKYCSLVKNEDGLVLLKKVLVSPSPYEAIKDLALLVMTNCSHYTTGDDVSTASEGQSTRPTSPISLQLDN